MKVSSIALVLVLLGLSWVQMTAPVFASTGAQQPTRHAALKTSGVTRAHPGKFNFAGVPLTFEKNVGQLDENIQFQARANGYSLFLTATGALVAFRVPVPALMMQSHRPPLHPQENVRWKYESCLVEMQFVAANANSRVIPGQ